MSKKSSTFVPDFVQMMKKKKVYILPTSEMSIISSRLMQMATGSGDEHPDHAPARRAPAF